jgi:hypothetical protein
MSRYTKTIINENNEVLELSWGFDNVLGYWYDIQNPMITEDLDIVEEWSSSLGYTGKHQGKDGKSRSTMLEFLIKYDLPEEHRSAVGLDMQF